MIHRAQIALLAFASLVAPGYEAATLQEPMPTVPSKQTPASSAALEGTVPATALADAMVEQASLVAQDDATAPETPLKELAWMVGDWIDDDDHATIESSVKWSKNGAFLIRSFRVSKVVAEPLSGMQVIAWDPAEKRIRSWTYDSRGGFGEEFWSRAGDQWSMRTRFTLPDGGRASAVQVMTRDSDDAFRWKSVSRVIDGVLQPDIDEVTVTCPVLGSVGSYYRGVAFSPNGAILAAGYDRGGGVVLFDVARRMIDQAQAVVEGRVVSVAFSPDGATLVAGYNFDLSAAGDGVVLFDVAQRARLVDQPLPVAEGVVKTVAFSPDGATLAVGYDGSSGVVLYNAGLESWKSLAGRIANRNLTRAEWRQFFPDTPYRPTFDNLPVPPE